VNRTARRLGTVVVLAGVAIASLEGCSSPESASPSTSAPSTSAAATTSAVAAAGCTKADFTDAAAAAVRAAGTNNVYRIDDVKCADGWAVTSGLWASTANPDMGAPSTLVFRQHDGRWVGQDKQRVCGTHATTTPAPVDAAIPAALYELGCLTG
jgi:hypothetical protein